MPDHTNIAATAGVDLSFGRALDVAAAAHGPTPTVLHATAAGRPLYERMGYRTIANHTVFMEQRFLETD